jgi:hypothetical protein
MPGIVLFLAARRGIAMVMIGDHSSPTRRKLLPGGATAMPPICLRCPDATRLFAVLNVALASILIAGSPAPAVAQVPGDPLPTVPNLDGTMPAPPAPAPAPEDDGAPADADEPGAADPERERGNDPDVPAELIELAAENTDRIYAVGRATFSADPWDLSQAAATAVARQRAETAMVRRIRRITMPVLLEATASRAAAADAATAIVWAHEANANAAVQTIPAEPTRGVVIFVLEVRLIPALDAEDPHDLTTLTTAQIVAARGGAEGVPTQAEIRAALEAQAAGERYLDFVDSEPVRDAPLRGLDHWRELAEANAGIVLYGLGSQVYPSALDGVESEADAADAARDAARRMLDERIGRVVRDYLAASLPTDADLEQAERSVRDRAQAELVEGPTLVDPGTDGAAAVVLALTVVPVDTLIDAVDIALSTQLGEETAPRDSIAATIINAAGLETALPFDRVAALPSGMTKLVEWRDQALADSGARIYAAATQRLDDPEAGVIDARSAQRRARESATAAVGDAVRATVAAYVATLPVSATDAEVIATEVEHRTRGEIRREQGFVWPEAQKEAHAYELASVEIAALADPLRELLAAVLAEPAVPARAQIIAGLAAVSRSVHRQSARPTAGRCRRLQAGCRATPARGCRFRRTTS